MPVYDNCAWCGLWLRGAVIPLNLKFLLELFCNANRTWNGAAMRLLFCSRRAYSMRIIRFISVRADFRNTLACGNWLKPLSRGWSKHLKRQKRLYDKTYAPDQILATTHLIASANGDLFLRYAQPFGIPIFIGIGCLHQKYDADRQFKSSYWSSITRFVLCK
jgi:hypothetical protein